MKLPAILRPSDNHSKVAKIGYGIIILTFGVLGGWAAFAPLDSAVTAQGLVASEGNRKTVQHLEGGIVRQIKVHEGDHVNAGQVLFEMDPTQATASYGITRNQLLALVAQDARLTAERDDAGSITWPAEIIQNQNDPVVARAMADEQKQFFERRATVRGQVDLLNAQKSQYTSEIEGITRQSEGLKEQVKYIDDELTGLKQIYDKGLVPRPRLLALERERAQLTGSIGRLIADRAKASQGLSETNLKARQIKQQFFEQVSEEIGQVRVKIADIRERNVVAEDAASRINVTAPVSGTAQSLRVFTNGAVIRPGEPMVDIVPDNEDLFVQAHFQPTDVDNIHVGMSTEVRFPAFHSRTVPMIPGKIASISRDRIIDEAAKTSYFLGQIRVDDKDMPKEIKARLTAGMPAQIIVPTGERTVLQYLFEPLGNTLRTTMREE